MGPKSARESRSGGAPAAARGKRGAGRVAQAAAGGAGARGAAPARKNHQTSRRLAKRSLNVYSAEDDKENPNVADRFKDVDIYEYELPEEFEDEEIDEDTAFGEDSDSDNEGPVGDLMEGLDAGEGVDADSGSDDNGDNGDKDDNGDDDGRHDRLLSAIASMDGVRRRKRKLAERSEAYRESEFNLNPVIDGGADGPIGVDDLVASLGGDDAAGYGSLKKKLARLDRDAAPLSTPLAKPAAARIERAVAYEATSKEVSKWVPTVKANREAEHLSFPLNTPIAGPNLTSVSLAASFKPETQMESEVHALLAAASGGKGDVEKQLLEAEQLALNELTVEEARERRKQLQKMRSVLSYYEEKCRRINRIKSKKYHRVKNRAVKRKEALREGDIPLENASVSKAERARVEERMTLRHKNKSKWAKRMLARGGGVDAGTREAIAEQLRIGDELRRKITLEGSDDEDQGGSEGEDSGDDEEEDVEPVTDSENEEEDGGVSAQRKAGKKTDGERLDALASDLDAKLPAKGLFGLKFMQRAIDKKRAEARQMLSELRDELGVATPGEGELVTPGHVRVVVEESGADVVSEAERSGASSKNRKTHARALVGVPARDENRRVGKNVAQSDDDSDTSAGVDSNMKDDFSRLHRQASESKKTQTGRKVFGKAAVAAPPTHQRADDGEDQGGDDDEAAGAGGRRAHVTQLRDAVRVDFTQTAGHSRPASAATAQQQSDTLPLGGKSALVFDMDDSDDGDDGDDGNGVDSDVDSGAGGRIVDEADGAPRSTRSRDDGEGIDEDANPWVLPIAGANSDKSGNKETGGSRRKRKADDDVMAAASTAHAHSEADTEAVSGKLGGSANESVRSADRPVKRVRIAGTEGAEATDAGLPPPPHAKAARVRDTGIDLARDGAQRQLIKMAFAGDDVVREFEDEKRALVDKETPKDEDMTLPGWGAWGGDGAPVPKRRFVKPAAPREPRRDDSLKHVIINEKLDKKAARLQVARVPHPFNSADQFERAMRNPLGKEWNTNASFKKAVMPKVSTKAGTIIEPIRTMKK